MTLAPGLSIANLLQSLKTTNIWALSSLESMTCLCLQVLAAPNSPTPALYFLLRELPIEARLHLDTMSLFYNIWANPQTTIHEVVKYLLQMADGKSTTWSAHLRLLAIQYNLPDPLALLQGEAWKKSRWTILIKTRITIFHEKQLREQALENSKMRYLNVELQGLSGAPIQPYSTYLPVKMH